MNFETRAIHIHLGVDNVFENAFEMIASLSIVEASPQLITHIPNAMYKRYFRSAVDSGHGILMSDKLNLLGLETGNLIISRPRFLYTGLPMNTEAGATKALYKLDSIQTAFSEFKLVFHLFVVDHLTYLFGLQKHDVSLVPDSRVSWAPLVNGVRARLRDANELHVQDAEKPVSFHQLLIMELLGHNEEAAAALHKKHSFGDEQQLPPDELEARAKSAGWNVDVLDDSYTRDTLQLFETH